jgi:lysophospholipase L1-like esterase
MTERNDALVIIGASYVRGWDLKEIAGIPVINKGVNGEQTFEMLRRFEQDVIASRPKAVIIWGYINDIFRSQKADIKGKLDASRENLGKMVEAARAHNIMPILVSEVTICGQRGFKESVAAFAGRLLGKESYQEYVNKHVRAVNEWLREYSRESNIALFDFEKVLADETGARKKEYAEADGSHISPRGYEKLNGYVQAHAEVFTKSVDCFVADTPSKENDKSS